MLTHGIKTDKSLYGLVLKRAYFFIVALVTGRADDRSCRRESVAVGGMWRTLPRTYVRGYGADVAIRHSVQMRPRGCAGHQTA